MYYVAKKSDKILVFKKIQCFHLGQYDCEFDNDGMCRWNNINNLWSRQRASNNVIGPSTDISFQTGTKRF